MEMTSTSPPSLNTSEIFTSFPRIFFPNSSCSSTDPPSILTSNRSGVFLPMVVARGLLATMARTSLSLSFEESILSHPFVPCLVETQGCNFERGSLDHGDWKGHFLAVVQ